MPGVTQISIILLNSTPSIYSYSMSAQLLLHSSMVGPAPPNWEQQLYVMGDSSERGYGGVLANMDDDKNLKPLAFKSAHCRHQRDSRA